MDCVTLHAAAAIGSRQASMAHPCKEAGVMCFCACMFLLPGLAFYTGKQLHLVGACGDVGSCQGVV